MRRLFWSAALGALVLIPVIVFSQETAFVWGHPWGVGSRATAMGGAYTAVADDYAALYYNPAGLGQVRKMSLSGSLSFLSTENKATFMGVVTSETPTASKLNDLGLCLPVPASRGSLAFGIGYHRVRLFDNGMLTSNAVRLSADAFPPDGYEGRWENERIESGALSNTSLGMSIEMAPGFFAGAAMNIWGGDDDYTWQFREIDEKNLYTYSDSTSTEHIATDFSGVNLTFGVLMKIMDRVSLGATVVTPVTLKAKESWDYADVFTWDGDQGLDPETVSDTGSSEYKVRAPWILRGGLALRPGPMLLSADGEFMNYSQFEYTTQPPQDGYSKTQANMDIKRNFRNVLNTRVGAEWTLPIAGARLRAGYAIYPSHLKNADSKDDRKVVSFGAGFRFMDQMVFDISAAMTSWNPAPYDVSIFGGSYSIGEKINTRNILFTFTYLM
jgi:long-subunit fatty acid transport protein